MAKKQLRGAEMVAALKAMPNRPSPIERITRLRNQLIELAHDSDPAKAENAKRTFLFIEAELTRLLRVGHEAIVGRPKKMRDAKAILKEVKRQENHERAIAALAWARQKFPTAAADSSIDFLKNKAAEHAGISRRQFNRWLGGK
jgi:hypothetical protein